MPPKRKGEKKRNKSQMSKKLRNLECIIWKISMRLRICTSGEGYRAVLMVKRIPFSLRAYVADIITMIIRPPRYISEKNESSFKH